RERERGRAVADRVRAAVVRDAERRTHALPGLDVPRRARRDARLLPQRELEHVRAGLVAARDEARALLGDAPERRDGALLALDPGGIGRGTDDDEVVVHDQPAVLHLAFGNVLP